MSASARRDLNYTVGRNRATARWCTDRIDQLLSGLSVQCNAIFIDAGASREPNPQVYINAHLSADGQTTCDARQEYCNLDATHQPYPSLKKHPDYDTVLPPFNFYSTVSDVFTSNYRIG